MATRVHTGFARSATSRARTAVTCTWNTAAPQGAVVLFSMQADDGRLFDILDKDMNVLGVVTVENLLAGRLMS
jgi:hypothetical protein